MDSWTNQYMEYLALEALGNANFPQGSVGFFLSSGCFVIFYQNTAGEEFLVYETADGVVKVPFEVPSEP